MRELIDTSPHDYIDLPNDRIMCAKCNININIHSNNKQTRMLVMTQCNNVKKRDIKPVNIGTQMYIGHKISHESHRLTNHRGLIYCARCGAIGRQRAYLLSSPCIPVIPGKQTHGQKNLRAISNDRLPQHILKWPDDDIPEDIKYRETHKTHKRLYKKTPRAVWETT